MTTTDKRVLITGAGGFIGRYAVNTLLGKGYQVIAGVHNLSSHPFAGSDRLKIIRLDILDRDSVMNAMRGVDTVFHFAALVDSGSSKELLYKINVEGTRIVWECAAECKATKMIYCSSTAVYGLLANSGEPITEKIIPRAIEPYGKSKLEGERAALDSGKEFGLHTTIIRPVAVFGPGEHTPFGRKFKDAVYSKILIAGAFQGKKFNYVHVEDVAEAAVYLSEKDFPGGEIFNITVNEPILYEEAFETYISVLSRLGIPFLRVKILALISYFVHKIPVMLKWIRKVTGKRFLFTIWHPGFDINYSSEKLLGSYFKFRHTDFEEVLYSCVERKKV